MTPAMGYTEMKDSGTVWLGNIPSDWAVSRIASLYSLRNEKVSDTDYPPLSVTMNGIVPQLATAAKTNDGDNRKLVLRGDFAINSRSDRRGSCGISSYDGSVSLINIILTPRKSMHPGYYNWLFHTSHFADEFYKWGHGIVDDLWTTRWQEMKRIIVPVPSYDVQETIATYLDTQCAKIDEVIAEAKASIEDYKQWKASVIYETVTKGLNPNVEMKESGTEWIDYLPVHVKISRVGLHYEIILGKMLCTEQVNAEYTLERYYCAANVHFDGISSKELKEMWFSPEEKRKYQVKKGDLLVVEGGAGAGGCAVSVTDSDGVFIQNSIMIVRPKGDAENRYLKYLLESYVHRGYVNYVCNKATIPHFTKEKLGIVPFPVFTLKEQRYIADYLDEQCTKIDVLIAEKQSLTADLESYKKSLIYEVVTGKRCISNPVETTVVAFHPTVLANPKVLLMCRVLELLGNDARGRIHVQKCMFTAECLLKMPFQTQYIRYEHGPHDPHITDFEELISENRWYTIQSGSRVTYRKGAHFDAYLDEYMEVFAGLDSKIKKIVEFLKPMNTSEAERVATLLAAWNDFILDGTAEPTDQQIINEVMTNWTPNKANTQVSTWQDTLNKMKRSNYIPKGFGLRTTRKETQKQEV